jgi:hypothetical protein
MVITFPLQTTIILDAAARSGGIAVTISRQFYPDGFGLPDMRKISHEILSQAVSAGNPPPARRERVEERNGREKSPGR